MKINHPTRIFVHTTAADYNTIPKQFIPVNSWHTTRFGEYCKSSMGYFGGYHTLIEKDGKEYRYREDWEESCAATGYNTSALHVALAFDGDKQLPTPAQVDRLRERINKWCKKYNISKTSIEFVGPHRLVNPSKTCYGALLSDEWALKLVQEINKTPEDKEKQDKTEEAAEEITKLQLLIEILKLKIKILLLQGKRQKTPPPVSLDEVEK